MRVLVTGAAGFVGSQVVRHLVEDGHETLALAVPGSDLWRLRDLLGRIHLIEGTLQGIGELAAELHAWKPEACIHLAWFAKPQTYVEAKENIDSLLGSLTLLQVLHGCGCKYLIAAGSGAEYKVKSGKLYENDAVDPKTLYAASKLAFLFLGQQITTQLGMQFAWGRIFYVYGPYEDPRRLVSSAILRLRNGEILPTSPGEQVRDYLHVEDVSRALVTIMEKQATGVFNVCSAEPITIKELLVEIGKILHRQDLVEFGALPYRDWEPMYVCGDNSRLKSLGWKPHFDLHTGLQHTVDWWSRNPPI